MTDTANDHPASKGSDGFKSGERRSRHLLRERGLLSPVERISEILFGMIMALSFTCTISVAESDRSGIRDMLIAVIGCNIAWGLVDAVMYTLNTLTEKSHAKSILQFIRRTKHRDKAIAHIADALPALVVTALEEEGLEQLRKTFLRLPEEALRVRLTLTDLRNAVAVFILVFLSTIPVALPFLFVQDVRIALRMSNGIAILAMFICGWLLGGYGGYNKLRTGLVMTLIGVILVGLTIALGG